MELFSILMYL